MLEALFDAARKDPPKVPDALMTQVVADAQAQMPGRGGLLSRMGRWVALLGGAPGMGGLVTACGVGFWIGLSAPAGLPDVAGALIGDTQAVSDEVMYAQLYDDGWLSGFEETFDDE